MARQLARDHPRKTYLAAIFQPQRNLPRYIVIADSSADTIMPGRTGEARRAKLITAAFKREW